MTNIAIKQSCKINWYISGERTWVRGHDIIDRGVWQIVVDGVHTHEIDLFFCNCFFILFIIL